jgi:haloacid dehalogenase-like hydrolase
MSVGVAPRTIATVRQPVYRSDAAPGDCERSRRDRRTTVTVVGATPYFRAVAVDFDGTLAEGEVAPETLAALSEARARGIRVILVTGRIMSELRAVFPEVDDRVDAVVAENARW